MKKKSEQDIAKAITKYGTFEVGQIVCLNERAIREIRSGEGLLHLPATSLLTSSKALLKENPIEVIVKEETRIYNGYIFQIKGWMVPDCYIEVPLRLKINAILE